MEQIAHLDRCPRSDDDYRAWRTGFDHVELLRRNSYEQDELIVAAFSNAAKTTYVHSAVLRADHPGLSDHEGLLNWQGGLFWQQASSVSSVISDDEVRFETHEHEWGTSALAGGEPLVYGRGLDGSDNSYYEVAQAYTHHLDIHWQPDRAAFSRFDHRGDWEDVVSITGNSLRDGVSLVSFLRDPLDQYLVEHGSVLVQLFDFTFRRPGSPPNWRGSTYRYDDMDRGMIFTQQFAGDGSISMVRGVQIVRPRLSRAEVEQRIKRKWGQVDREPKTPVEFIVLDMRTGEIATVSTDPASTATYFEPNIKSLPYETSPAFFRPEVLSKYKADSDKYTVYENWISCRGGWDLGRYRVNEADQVAVYIFHLRDLPYEEQLHWALYNENPKAPLSDRTIATDFRGEWPKTIMPREMLVYTLERWRRLGIKWWRWHPDRPPDHLIVTPRTESRDEWEKAIADLSKRVIEGFVVKELRRILETEGIRADKSWQSIALTERILHSRGALDKGSKLTTLRGLRAARNLSGTHLRGSDAKEYVQTVRQDHGTYAAHYEQLCEKLSKELALIEKGLDETPTRPSEDGE